MFNSMWTLCGVNCPALPYETKLEVKNNSLNWSSQANENTKGMDYVNNKKDHLVIATQPKNHVINRIVAPSSQHSPIADSRFISINPITNLLTSSDIRSTSPGGVVVAAANRFLSPIKSSDPLFGGFGCRKKQHSVYNRNKAEIVDVNGFGLRSKSEERQSTDKATINLTTNQVANSTVNNNNNTSIIQHSNKGITNSTKGLSKNHSDNQPVNINHNTNQRSRSVEPNNRLTTASNNISYTRQGAMEATLETNIIEPASNPNNCGKRVKNVSGCSEYRSAFNWPPGSQSSTLAASPNHHHQHQQQTANNNGPSAVSLINGVNKSQTISDFSEISANSQLPAISAANQFTQIPAGLPSSFAGRVGKGEGTERKTDHPQMLFSRATPPPPVVDKPEKTIIKTEYKKKFKPFSTYVYIPGSGWKKSKKDSGCGGTGVIGGSSSEGALEWYDEVVERAKKACEFRSRSQFGHPIVGVDHLETIYRETSSNLWNQPKNRSIAALALATSYHLREPAKPSKGSSRDSSRDSSKAGSDRVTSTSSHPISPQKENSTSRKQFAEKAKPNHQLTASTKTNAASRKPTPAPKSKALTDKKRSGGLSTPGGAKPASVESEGGKIWLKPRREEKPVTLGEGEEAGKGDSDNKDSTIKAEEDDSEKKRKASQGETDGPPTGASSLGTSGSLTPLLSPREKDEVNSNNTKSPNTSDDQPRSPRPNSLVGSITNGIDLTSPPALPDGPVKTTEIKSPEEVTGVKSPSPELWRVTVDTGTDINWKEAKPTNILDNNNKINDSGVEDNEISMDPFSTKLTDQSNDKDSINQKQPEDAAESAKSSETNEDLYGPLSI